MTMGAAPLVPLMPKIPSMCGRYLHQAGLAVGHGSENSAGGVRLETERFVLPGDGKKVVAISTFAPSFLLKASGINGPRSRPGWTVEGHHSGILVAVGRIPIMGFDYRQDESNHRPARTSATRWGVRQHHDSE